MIQRSAASRGGRWQVTLCHEPDGSFTVKYYKNSAIQGWMGGLPTVAAANAEFDRHMTDALRYDGIRYVEA